MIRTQISLSEKDYKAAKMEANKLGISLAEFFRIALREKLPVNKKNPWMHYCGIVETGDKHSSNKIDDIIYGQK